MDGSSSLIDLGTGIPIPTPALGPARPELGAGDDSGGYGLRPGEEAESKELRPQELEGD